MATFAPRLPSSISRGQVPQRAMRAFHHQSTRRIDPFNNKAFCNPRRIFGWRHHHLRPTVRLSLAAPTQWQTFASATTDNDGKAGHAAFEEQLKELQEEREAMFGSEDDPTFVASDTNHADFERQLRELQEERNEVFGIQDQDENDDNENDKEEESSVEEDWDLEDHLFQLKEERNEVFGFTHKEHTAWSNLESGTDKLPASLFEEIQQARADADTAAEETQGWVPSAANNKIPITENVPAHGLTHLSDDGKSINMVDVGQKAVTQRMARAETRVIFPPEVVKALQLTSQGNEIMGPKGPIFATAKLAGIMAAKKTSDLIPLCHPLPLDKVQVDIRMQSSNTVLISCECRLTHKTGVEMEALTGASVAALTIYDMVKAISHNVRIEGTVLVSKTGGKRTVGPSKKDGK